MTESLEAPVVEIKKRGRPPKVRKPAPEILDFKARIETNPEEIGNSIRGFIESEHEVESINFDLDKMEATIQLVADKSFSINFVDLGLEKRTYFVIYSPKSRFDFNILFVPSKTNRLIRL